MGALFHRSKVTRRSQCSCFELESRRTHCCLLETVATVFLDSILAALDSTQYRLIPTFVFVICSTKKQNLQQHHSAARKGASRSAFSLIPTWYSDTIHHALLMEPFLRPSEHWKGLIQRREIDLSTLFVGRDVTSSHTWAELCCFSCHTFFLHAFHFGIQSYAWNMTIFSS